MDFLQVFSVNHSKNLKKKNVQNDFSEKWHKIMTRRLPTEISGDQEFIDRNFVEKQFRGRGVPIDDLGPFFQKSKPEISVKWEKTCFLCCRFFLNRQQKQQCCFFGAPQFFVYKFVLIYLAYMPKIKDIKDKLVDL